MNALRAILEWARAQPVLAILVMLLIVLLAVFVIVGVSDPAWVYRFFGVEEGTEKFRILEFVGVGMGGALLAIGAAIANRRAKAMAETANAQTKAAEAQAQAAQQQATANRGAEDGRRQERLKNAIEHLGHESDSVRLGGAYELFHLARDTEDLRQTVMDILCAHVRRTTGEDEYREKHKSKPSTEIQSLLTLLFVQEHEVFTGCRVDLQVSWLNRASLTSARLQGANLAGAYLQRANLSEAHLQGARLSFAHLQGAQLSFAHLQEARLVMAHLQEAWLARAHLQGADLSKAHLQGAILIRAHLQGADLSKAHLRGVNLSRAHLQGSDLSGAHLQGSDLYWARLQGAKLLGAHLRGVICQLGGYSSFEERIRVGIGRKDNLSEATFAGGLRREDVDSLVEGLVDKAAESLRQVLEPHVGKPASNELPGDSGAITGTYTEEEAKQWIAEYRKTTGG